MITTARGYTSDWEFLIGDWEIRHRQLKSRLSNCRDWIEFGGNCTSRPMMLGQANVDDYLIDAPSGQYRAMAIRSYDLTTDEWSIWWIDSRRGNSVGEPVRGHFSAGAGVFYGDDTHDGKAIKVRFVWSQITADGAKWEQAFSPDGGKTWEPNWIMRFTRSGLRANQPTAPELR